MFSAHLLCNFLFHLYKPFIKPRLFHLASSSSPEELDNDLLHIFSKEREKHKTYTELHIQHTNTESAASLWRGKSQGMLEGVKEEWMNCVSIVLKQPMPDLHYSCWLLFRYICLLRVLVIHLDYTHVPLECSKRTNIKWVVSILKRGFLYHQ